MSLKVLGYENDECANINGTHLVGEIKTTYDKLVEKFGQPTYTEADPYEKVACEWTIDAAVVEDSPEYTDDDYFYKPFTVYCWKEGRIPTDEYSWHIGGHDYEAFEIAANIINGE